MDATIDISDLRAEITALSAGAARHSVAVVVPLREGWQDVVADFLDEGPPFDPAEAGLVEHKVFLTGREAIFVFEAVGAHPLEHILAESDFWDVLPAWQDSAAERPRVGVAVYEWPQPRGRRSGQR